jgi:hypothetical protein
MIDPNLRNPRGPSSEAPRPPEPTDDPLIDEVRQLKYEFAAQFGHDLDRMFEHLRQRQEQTEREQPGRVAQPSAPKPKTDAPAA